MGVKLDDIIGNKNDDILVDKTKRTMNMLMIGVAVVVILIVIIGIVLVKRRAEEALRTKVKNIISDTNAISGIAMSLDESQYLGKAQDKQGVTRPVSIEINGQLVEYKYGYYLCTAEEVAQMVPTIIEKDQQYIINYKNGEVINLEGVKYKGKRYHEKEDLIAIEKLLNPNSSKGVYIPSDYTTFINSPKDMLEMAKHPDYFYKLTKDIDMSELYSEGGDGWAPIEEFNGFFDGRGYTISNLYVNRNNSYGNCGLFGKVGSDAEIVNLKLKNVNVSGGNYTGAIAGSFAGLARNCEITGTVNGNGDVGGVFGNFTGKATNITSKAIVNGLTYKNVGGFAGSITTGEIEKAAVKETTVTNGAENVGGFAGLIAPQNNLLIKECLVKDVKIKGPSNVGGFVGNINGIESNTKVDINNCYANRVSVLEGCSENGGGFAGIIDTNGKSIISLGRIYSTTYVTNSNIKNRGGFVGKYLPNATTNIEYCYWQKESLDEIESVGNYDDDAAIGQSAFTPYTAEQIRSVGQYSGWVQGDLNLWVFDGKNPPSLAWEE